MKEGEPETPSDLPRLESPDIKQEPLGDGVEREQLNPPSPHESEQSTLEDTSTHKKFPVVHFRPATFDCALPPLDLDTPPPVRFQSKFR